MRLFRSRNRFRLEHEREDRFHDKIRADGKSVFYDGYVRGQGRKLELLQPEPERWQAFWDEAARLGLTDWSDERATLPGEDDESWWILLDHQGRRVELGGDGRPVDELFTAVSALVGFQLASAREALLPEPRPWGEDEENEEDADAASDTTEDGAERAGEED